MPKCDQFPLPGKPPSFLTPSTSPPFPTPPHLPSPKMWKDFSLESWQLSYGNYSLLSSEIVIGTLKF